MQVGDHVFYKGQKAQIIDAKWGLCCIKFLGTRNQIWVNPEVLTRKDF